MRDTIFIGLLVVGAVFIGYGWRDGDTSVKNSSAKSGATDRPEEAAHSSMPKTVSKSPGAKPYTPGGGLPDSSESGFRSDNSELVSTIVQHENNTEEYMAELQRRGAVTSLSPEEDKREQLFQSIRKVLPGGGKVTSTAGMPLPKSMQPKSMQPESEKKESSEG